MHHDMFFGCLTDGALYLEETLSFSHFVLYFCDLFPQCTHLQIRLLSVHYKLDAILAIAFRGDAWRLSQNLI